MPANELAEKRALKQLRSKKNHEVLATLIDAYGDELFRFCKSMVYDKELAMDVLQSSYLKAFESLPTFKGNSSFRTWMYTIVRHRSLDEIKTRRRLTDRIHFSDEPGELTSNPAESDPKIADALSYCLGKLNSEISSAVLMRYQSELSYQEMSSITLDKAGTLQAKVARALPLLKKCLENRGVML